MATFRKGGRAISGPGLPRRIACALLMILFWAAGPPFAVASEPPGLERIERSDEQLLILSLVLGSHLLSDGIFAYSEERGILLPLGELVDLLELPMDIDVEGGWVEGWVTDPDQPFVLDIASRTVTLDGVTQRLSPDALVEAHPDELFVGSDLLASWWPVEVEIDLGGLRAILASSSRLPVEKRLERRSRWARWNPRGDGGRSSKVALPALHEPYRLLDWPAIDGTVDVAWRRSSAGESSRLMSYSGLAQGDFLGLTADLFWSGADENGSHRISGRRLSLSRTDSDAGLLGPLRADRVRVGDLLGLAHPLITHGRGGRGFGIERARARHGSHFDHTVLYGDVLPGWDVELYRGDQLLDFQTVGVGGRYEFRDIPLLVGRNDLRVLMFGPHGEQRERVEKILVGPRALPPGEIRYRVDLVEQGRGLLGASGDPSGRLTDGVPAPGQGEMVLGGTLEVGLTRRWTASAGALSLPIESRGDTARRSYAWLGFEGSVLGTAGLIEVVRDVESGWAGRIAAQRRIGSVGLRLEHRQFLAFLSEQNRESGLEGVTELRLDSVLPFRGRSRMPISFLSTLEQRETGTVFRARGELSYAAKLGSIRLANRWAVEAENHEFSARGRTTLHGRLAQLPVRGRLAYEVWPRTDLTSLNLDVRWERRQKLTTTFGVDYDLKTGVGRLRAGLDWQTRRQHLTLSVDGGSDGSFSLQLGTRFSLRRDAISRRYRMRTDASAKQGVAKVLVFLDDNDNGSLDPGDQTLENVAFELAGRRHPVTTDEDGVAYLVIGSHRRTDLAIAEGSLEDPYWQSSTPGVEVLTRPGRTELVTFPILNTGEIDGTVYLVRDSGKMAVGGVEIELVDEDGIVVSRTESQYDGFYLFEKVRPGNYHLLISPSSVDRWSLERPEPVTLDVGVGMILGGVDFHVELTKKEPAASREL